MSGQRPARLLLLQSSEPRQLSGMGERRRLCDHLLYTALLNGATLTYPAVTVCIGFCGLRSVSASSAEMLTHTHTRLTALIRDYPGEAVPER